MIYINNIWLALRLAGLLRKIESGNKHCNCHPAEINKNKNKNKIAKVFEELKSFITIFDVEDKNNLYSISYRDPVPNFIKNSVMTEESANEVKMIIKERQLKSR